MNKKLEILIVFLAATIFVWGLYSIFRLIIIKNKGSQITAIVQAVDTNCDRYNKIEVAFDGETYPVSISKTDCRDGVYKVGQRVTLIKYKDDDTLVWPEAKYEWLPFIILVLLALAYYTNKDKFAKHNKSKPDTVSAKKSKH